MDNRHATESPTGNGCLDDQQVMRECLSAWVDGDWDGAQTTVPDAERLFNEASPGELKQCWSEYHLIGEVLRSGGGSARGADPAFVNAVMGRIQAERMPEASGRDGQIGPASTMTQHVHEPVDRGEAANDAVFRWKMLAGGATVVAVLAVAWQVMLGASLGEGAVQLADAKMVVPTVVMAAHGSDNQGQMIRDPRLQALMAEHRQNGGMTAWQMPAGFLRNATYEPSTR